MDRMKKQIKYLIIYFLPIFIVFGNASPLTGPGSTVPVVSVSTYKHLSIHIDLAHMNLDKVTNNELSNAETSTMMKYRAEAFLSSLIYFMKKDDKKKYYYGKYRYAQLLYYEVNDTTGFNAGIFKTNTGKVVIVFGGTSASSPGTDEKNDKLSDVIADINLLNQSSVHPQYKQAIDFINKAIGMIDVIQSGDGSFDQERDVSITGHSLGGALAQFAALYSSYKAVTFDTAPILTVEKHREILGNISDEIIQNRAKNIVNIMPFDDPLTSVIDGVETYIQNDYAASPEESQQYQFQYDYLVTPKVELYKKVSSVIKYTSLKGGILVKAIESPELASLITEWVKEDKQMKILNENLKERFGVNSDAVILEMIAALKARNLSQLVEILIPIYGIKDKNNLYTLIHGEKIVLPIFVEKTFGHSMDGLIQKVYGEDALYADYYSLKLPDETVYSDVGKNHIFFTPISILAKSGAVDAKKEKYFPEEDVTRAELFKMLSLYFLKKKWELYSFKRHTENQDEWGFYFDWQRRFSEFMKDYVSDKSGTILDYAQIEDLFDKDKLNNPISRNEAVAIVLMLVKANTFIPYRYARNYKGCAVGNDWNTVSTEVRSYGIVKGYSNGCFGAVDFLNRGQMAAILVNTENWIKRNYYEWEGLK